MVDFIDGLIERLDEFLTAFIPILCTIGLLNIFFQIITK